MSSRWFLARNAARKCIIIASRVPRITIFPSSYLPKLQTPHHFNNHHRFFSNQFAQHDAVPPSHSEHFAVAEEEEEAYEIDAEKLDAVKHLLIQQTDSEASLESSLIGMDLTLHHDFVTGIIQSETISVENRIRFFNWASKEKSFKVTISVLESLVSAVCGGSRREEVYTVWDLVKEIGEKENGIVNVRILNELIVSMSKLGKGKAALEVFDKFEAVKCVPNEDSYYFTVEALCKRSCFDWAWNVCRKMIDAKSVPDGEKVGNMLCWLCKGKKVREAHELYVAAMEEKKKPPMYCVSLLVGDLCSKNESVRLASEVLSDICGEERKHAIKPFSAVVKGLCRIKDVNAAKDLVMEMIADGPPPGNAVFNFVITGYCKAGEIGRAMEMVRLLESRGLKPDLYTYGVLMSGYSNGGEMEEAMKLLEEAKKKYVKLTPVVYHTLIRGYCKLEQFDKALKLLDEMKDYGVRQSADEYEKLIQSLCLKALDWEMAEKLLNKMTENGLHLKGITRALISAVKEMDKEAVEARDVSSPA